MRRKRLRDIRSMRRGAAALSWLAIAVFSVACAGQPADTSDTPEPGPAARGPTGDGAVRLYVADRYEGVFELDANTLEVVDLIDTGPRPHGLLASPDGTLLYITVETSNELLKVDVATNEILDRTEVGPVPNEPTITHDGRYIYVPQRGGDQAYVVDTETMEVVKTLPAGNQQHNAYTSADGERVYLTSMGDDIVSVIDTATQEILRQVPMGGVPRTMAILDDESAAYVHLSGLLGLVVWDLQSDEIVRRVELPIPEGTPIPPLDTYSHGLLLTPDQRELWFGGYGVNKIYALTVPELEQIAEIEVEGGPHWVTLHPSGEPLYFSLETAGSVVAVHRGLREVIRTGQVGQAPTRILTFRGPAAQDR